MWKDKFILVPLILGSLLILASFILALTKLSFPLETSLVVRYESLRGVRDFGNVISIISIVLVALFYLLADFFLAWFIYGKRKLYSYLISYTSLFFSLLILIYIGVIIGAN